VKFTPVGSEITLEVRREGTWATFCVADQGPGVPPEQQPQVFDRFWRSTGSAVKGTGLGLFIAKGIVDAHGGKIWIDTSTNGGARFHFTLPAVDSISTNISEGSEAATECLQMEPFKKLLA
jgi:signal transduction histidine kinase